MWLGNIYGNIWVNFMMVHAGKYTSPIDGTGVNGIQQQWRFF